MQQDGQETMPEGEHEEEKQLDQLKHIVSRTLEAKGVLGTIRAQLRAAVFTALDEQERANGVYLENYRVQKIKSSPESKLLLALMHEFFEFYELDRTLSVFMPEATWTQAEYPGRQQLSRDLGFASTSTREAERPILLDLLLERLAEPKPMGDRRASGMRSREPNSGGRRTPKSPGSANVSPRSPAKPSSTSVSSLRSPRSPRSARSPRSGGSGRTSTRSGAKQSPGSSPRTQNSTGLHGKKPHDSNPVMMANLANASLPEAVTREIASAKSRVLPEAFGEATSSNLARGRKSLSSPHSGRSDIEEEQKEYKVPGKDIWDGSLSSPSACNEIGNQSVSNDGSMPAVDQMHTTASLSASASYDKEDDAASEQSQTAQSLSERDQNSPDAASPGLASLKSESVLSSIVDSAPSSAYSNESHGLATPNAVASSSNEGAAQHTTAGIEHDVSGPSSSEKQPTTPPTPDNEGHAATTHNLHLEQSSLGSIGKQSFFSSPHEAKSLGKGDSSSESVASSGRDVLGGPIAIDSVVSPLDEALNSHSVDAEEHSDEGSLATPAETVPAVHVLPSKEAVESFGADSLSGSPLAEDGQSLNSFKVDVAGATSTRPLRDLAAPSALEQNSSDASSLASSAVFSHKEAKPSTLSDKSLSSIGSPTHEAVMSSSPNSSTFADRPKTLGAIDAISSESFGGNEDGLSTSSSQEKALDQGLSPASRSSAQGSMINTSAQEKAAEGSVSDSASAASDVDDFEVDSEVSDNNGLMGLDTEENDVGDFDDESHSSKKEDSQSVASLSPVRTQAAAAPVPPLATQAFDASFDSDGEDFGVSRGASNVATDQATLSEEQTKQSARRSEALSFEDEKPSASPEGFNSDFDSEDETFGVTFAPKEPASRRVEASENANEEDSDAGEESVAEHSMTEASVDHLHDIAKGQMNSEDEGKDEEDSASDAEDAGDEVDGIASDEDNDSENNRSHDGLFSASHEESNDFDVANQGREDARASEDDEDDDEDRGLEKNQASDIVQDEDSMSHEDSMSLGNSHSISQNEQSSEFGIDDQDKEQEDALMNQDEEEVLGNNVSEIDEYAHDDQEMSHGDSHSISQHDESSEFSMADQNKEQEDALMAQEEEEGLGNDVSDIDEHAQDDQDVANGESHSFSLDDESSESSMADQDKEQEDASMDQEKEEDFGNEVSKIEGDTRNDTSAGLAGAGSSSLVESAGLMSPVKSPPRQGITSPNEDEQSGFSFDASFNSDEDVGINLSGAPSMAKTGASTQMGSEELNEENVGLLGRKGEVEMDELDNSGEGDDAEDGHDVKSDDEDALDNLSTSEDIVVENDDHSELEDVFGEKSHDLSGDEDNEKDFGDDGEGEDEDEDEDEEDYGEDFEEDFEEESGGEEEDEAQGDDLDLDGDEQMSIPSEVESVSSVESALSAKSGTSDLVSVEHDDAPTAHIKIDLDEQIVETVEHGVDDHTLESACDDVFG